MSPNKYELQHAIEYATHLTRVYMMEQYNQKYPLLFQHAKLESRPATNQDYYVPPTLSSECIVTHTLFDETGCSKLACYPFTSNGMPCNETHGVHWVHLGTTNGTFACQAACKYSTVDTEWWDEECRLVNPLKKLLASFPERVFELESKHALHAGLDFTKGQIQLNKEYCRAYGLNLSKQNDCETHAGQDIIESIFGKTFYRLHTTTFLPAPRIGPSPHVPDILKDVKTLEPILPPVTDIVNTVDYSKLGKQIATELALDFGLDITAHVVEKILRKKVPKLLTKAVSSVPIRSVLVQVLLKQYLSTSIRVLTTVGRGLGTASNIFTIYSILSLILDIFDPFHYDKVLDAEMVKAINRRLDWYYFERGDNFNPVVTPEYVWDNVLNSEDESDRYEYMAEKVEEYLTALHTDSKSITNAPPRRTLFNFKPIQDRWNWTWHSITVVMITILALMSVQWAHVWGLALFSTAWIAMK